MEAMAGHKACEDTLERTLSDTLRIDLGSAQIDLSAAIKAARHFLSARRVSDRATFSALLVFEELVTNTLRYAHPENSPRIVVATLCAREDSLRILIEDDGVAFDPSRATAPNRVSGHTRIGGLGLELVRNMAESLDYERAEGRNRVTAKIAFA